MLKARNYVEDVGAKVREAEGRNIKEINTLKETFLNIL
jgi:hypothetical protein